jgi:hypothetical protein
VSIESGQDPRGISWAASVRGTAIVAGRSTRSLGSMRTVTSVFVGAATFSALQVSWALGHALGASRSAWLMKTGSGIGLSFCVLLLLGAVVSARARGVSGPAKTAMPVALGAIAAMAVALLVIGPGNLWPLVIVFDGAIIGAAVLIGGTNGVRFRSENAA